MEYFTLRNGMKMPAIGCGTVTFGREGAKLEKELADRLSIPVLKIFSE